MTIDPTYLRSVLEELVRAESMNPTLVEGGSGEAEAAACIADRMEALGMEVELHDAAPGRTSAVGRLPGAGGTGGAGTGPSLLWNGHLDTVGVEGMEHPFEPRVEGDRLYARGAYDMKGALASCLAAVQALRDAGVRLAGDLVIAAVADEEDASIGTADVLTRWRADGAIVVEPTELALALAHKGFVWLDLETRGRAAHGSRWDLGVDANLAIAAVLAEVGALEKELRARPHHPLVGPPSLHVGVLSGGTGASTYAARAAAQIERRAIPGETVAGIEAEVAAAVDRARAARDGLDTSLSVRLARPAFEARDGSPLAAAVESSAAEVLGAQPPRIGVPFWTDAALFADAGIDTVLIGPVGAGAHEPVEWVDLGSCVRLADVLARTAIRYCGIA